MGLTQMQALDGDDFNFRERIYDIIDFIDMKTEADKLEVLSTLNNALKKDPVKATLVDMTKLNLAEVTRKKVKRSLREQLGNYDYRRN